MMQESWSKRPSLQRDGSLISRHLFFVNQSTPGIIALLINFKYAAVSEFPNYPVIKTTCLLEVSWGVACVMLVLIG